MAYLTLMASVAEAEVDAFRINPSLDLHPSLTSGASHALCYCVEVQPLGQWLGEAVDGGELLHADLWHPLRPPMFQRPTKVRELAKLIEVAWERENAVVPQDDDVWLTFEIGRLLRLYGHAATEGECVVTALGSPADHDRARRVRIPW